MLLNVVAFFSLVKLFSIKFLSHFLFMQISVHFDIYTLIMNKSCFISLICTIVAWFIVVHKSFNRAHYIFRTWYDRIGVELVRICFSFIVVVEILKTPLKDIHSFGHTLFTVTVIWISANFGIIYWSKIRICPFELCEIVCLTKKELIGRRCKCQSR